MASEKAVALPDKTAILLHAGRVCGEVRRFNPGWWFVRIGAKGAERLMPPQHAAPTGVETTRIFSFGACQMQCPYCKRGMAEWAPHEIQMVATTDLFTLALEAVERGERVRLSGGDPSTFPAVSVALAQYVENKTGHKASIAHHGFAPGWMRRIAPHLLTAAIDVKGTPETISNIAGMPDANGTRLYDNALRSVEIAVDEGVLLDVRTPVFASTKTNEMLRIAQAL